MNLNTCACAHHTYSLLPLHCGQRSLVGNRLACSVCNGLVGNHRSGYRKKRIGISVDAPLKFRFDVADAVKLAVLIPKEIELQLLALLDALQVFDVLGEDG